MAETIDEATIIAWVDGTLDDIAGARVARAVAADPALAALAERHQAMKSRLSSAFDPIARQPVDLPERTSADIISLAAVRAEREAQAAPPKGRSWVMGGAIAASLILGLLSGNRLSMPTGIADQPDALALATPIARALDGQLSGENGVIRVSLSFKDRDGHYCRSFAGQSVSGIACRDAGRWRMRYASAVPVQATDYRTVGSDATQAEVVAAMIAGDPLGNVDEAAARKAGWH